MQLSFISGNHAAADYGSNSLCEKGHDHSGKK
jgi:hypothetical protein